MNIFSWLDTFPSYRHAAWLPKRIGKFLVLKVAVDKKITRETVADMEKDIERSTDLYG